MPSRISIQISRLDLDIDLFPYLPQNVGWDIFGNVFEFAGASSIPQQVPSSAPVPTVPKGYTRTVDSVQFLLYNYDMSEQSVSFSKARERFRALLEEVERSGRPMTILRRGKPQAVLLSYEQYRKKGGKDQAESWRLEGSLRSVRGVNIDAAILAVRESAKKRFERSIVRHGFHKPDA